MTLRRSLLTAGFGLRNHGAMPSNVSNLPPALDQVQPQLSSGHGIEICVLPADAHLAVSQSAAVATALERFGQSSSADVGAFAVAATARHYGDVLPDGTLQLPR
jgi:hypothetical protein